MTDIAVIQTAVQRFCAYLFARVFTSDKVLIKTTSAPNWCLELEEQQAKRYRSATWRLPYNGRHLQLDYIIYCSEMMSYYRRSCEQEEKVPLINIMSKADLPCNCAPEELA